METPAAERAEIVPEWAVRILRTAVRDYRYAGLILQGTSDERVLVGVRRGDRVVGHVEVTHTMLGPRHVLRGRFASADRAVEERVAARSLDQWKQSCMLLLERICRYGCSLDPAWCQDCSQSERHRAGQFRGVAQEAGGTPENESPPPVPQADAGDRPDSNIDEGKG